jgi:peptidyl-prolyl cis-trans isomerase SurA
MADYIRGAFHTSVRVVALLLLLCASPTAIAATAAAPAAVPDRDATRIVAIVNGQVISNTDVDNRARLFALSTGLKLTPDVLDRLKHQIVQQLVDERLRMQALERNKIIVPDKAVADAIREIEARNNLAPGALRQKLAADGVSQITLIDQIRTQLGWSQLLRQELGSGMDVTPEQIAEQQRLESTQVGQPEYQVGEIFIPVDEPATRADAERFAETVISDLRAGAPFGLVAAQFSQNQTALQGGELGWVQANQLDPAVASLVRQMPVGAVSNPVAVPGGFSIVTLQGKRVIGHDMGTVLTMREAFVPFATPLNPQAPTDQQREALNKARAISAGVHSCEQMEQVAKNNPATHPVNPGDVRLENVNPPAFRELLATVPLGHATQPLVSRDGISVVVVCSREQKNLDALTAQEVKAQLLRRRVELLSERIMRELRRTSNIELRTNNRA